MKLIAFIPFTTARFEAFLRLEEPKKVRIFFADEGKRRSGRGKTGESDGETRHVFSSLKGVYP